MDDRYVVGVMTAVTTYMSSLRRVPSIYYFKGDLTAGILNGLHSVEFDDSEAYNLLPQIATDGTTDKQLAIWNRYTINNHRILIVMTAMRQHVIKLISCIL